MRDIVLYLHMHQPYRVGPYDIFAIGERHDYFNSYDIKTDNQAIFSKVAHKSYYPMITELKRLCDELPGFALNLSITGVFLEQCEAWEPALLADIKELVATGKVELVAETYYHSLAFFYSRFEFEKQVRMHADILQKHFGVKPQVFRNTELAYNNELGYWAETAGYKAVITEGWDPVLDSRNVHQLYSPKGATKTALFLKDYRLSDDIAFRFSNRQWADWPLTADKYKNWIDSLPLDQKLINLFMDFETFGEHQWESTGIFDFFDEFVRSWCGAGNRFMTFSGALERHEVSGMLDVPETITWADNERDLSAWLGNALQREAIEALYRLENSVLHSGDPQLVEDWRRLQASDLLYYLSTKWYDDGNVHAYFSPYDSPYDGFLNYMNAIRDIRYRLSENNQNRAEVAR